MTSDHLFVVAIDFGTTYSGYAFSSKDDFNKNPCKISAHNWNSGEIISLKTPTVVLLNPDGSFHSFGYEAENEYSQLLEQESVEREDEEENRNKTDGGEDKNMGKTYKDYFYFERFKMLLDRKKVNRMSKIKDITGKEVPALNVFSLAIKYLSDHALKAMKNKIINIEKSDIRFVLTVPAIWLDRSKQFMREAAKMAGLDGNHLIIALEPEAGALWCQYEQFEKVGREKDKSLSTIAVGAKYMICDIGGGTTDITVHKKEQNDTLAEILPASGGPWGGTSVDKTFQDFLCEIFEHMDLSVFKKHLPAFMQLMRSFEIKKRKRIIHSKNSIVTNPRVVIDIPYELVDICKLKNELKSKYRDLKFARNKLHIPQLIFESFFQTTCGKISDKISECLSMEQCEGLKNIILIGGFAECEILQNIIKEKFSNHIVSFPQEAGISVLKGAVIYGHKPTSISSRISRFTYGVQSWPEFNIKEHPLEKKITLYGTDRCKDAFFSFVKVGETVKPGHKASQLFKVLNPSESTLECIVFYSTKSNPTLTDECTKLGSVTVPMNANQTSPLEVEETLVFGETEIKFEVKNKETNQPFDAYFDLLL